MHKYLLLFTGMIMCSLLATFGVARLSYYAPKLGLLNGQLSRCPLSPNCINSEDGPIEPIRYADQDHEIAWQSLIIIIKHLGGKFIKANGNYLRATFSSPFFGFIDDLEIRRDTKQHLIHLRSASRVGYSDFGANEARVKTIKQKMRIYLNQDSLNNRLND